MRKRITDTDRIDHLESAGYSLDLCRLRKSSLLRVYPRDDGTDDRKHEGKTIRSAIDKSIRESSDG